MPRKRKYTGSSALRHKLKMERVLLGRPTEPTAAAAATAINAEWEFAFGPFKDDYARLKAWLSSKYPDVPRGQYAFYRSFLFRSKRLIPMGYDPAAIIDAFGVSCGLREDVCWDILEQFGLATKRETEEAVPAK
jgi:hypothetical protein